jgi:hypothetical protein
VTSIKQLNKVIQKAPLGKYLHFVLQRPCIIMSNHVQTSSTVGQKKPQTAQNIPSPAVEEPPAIHANNTNQPQDQSAASLAPDSNMTVALTPVTTPSNTIMATTRSRLEQIKNFRLDPKIKFPFSNSGGGGTSPMTPMSGHQLAIDLGEAAANTSNSTATTPGLNVNIAGSVTPSAGSSLNKPLTPAFNAQVSTSSGAGNNSNNASNVSSSYVTHTASSSNLVDFFCSASECSIVSSVFKTKIIT